MKLVELLAREVSEWPKEATHASQDYDREIRFYDADEDQLSLLDFFVEDHADDACDAITFAGGGVRVTRAQWQAERDRQKGGEWKRHRGGKCPVDGKALVEYRLRDGYTDTWTASSLDWSHTKVEGDVMSYRVISQPQAEAVMKGPFVAIPAGESLNEIEIEDFISSGVCKTDQIDGPIKWRDTIIHCQAIIEDCEREIERNVELLDAEGLMMQVDSKRAMQAYDVDMSDWRNLKEGDIIECGDKGWSSSFEGVRVTVKEIESVDYTGSLPINGVDDNGDEDWGESYTFIRRP